MKLKWFISLVLVAIIAIAIYIPIYQENPISDLWLLFWGFLPTLLFSMVLVILGGVAVELYRRFLAQFSSIALLTALIIAVVIVAWRSIATEPPSDSGVFVLAFIFALAIGMFISFFIWGFVVLIKR